MPCVLPVISLKIFGFVRHAGDSRARIFRSGLAFVAGIFVWFIGLALVLIGLKMAGHELTWAVQFTNPYFVLGMSAVVLVFALNLFGVFEISLPQRATSSLDERDRIAKAMPARFSRAVFATVLAHSMHRALSRHRAWFRLHSIARDDPAHLRRDRGGNERAISAPFGAASLAEISAQARAMDGTRKTIHGLPPARDVAFPSLRSLALSAASDAVIWASSFLLAVSVACWMKGSFVTLSSSIATRVIVLALIFVLVLGSGFYFIGKKFRAAELSTTATQSQGDWQPFTPERLQSEIAQGHNVFVDFTAAWCITCKFNEATVLESEQVRDAFKRNGIVKLKADWTNADPAITKILKQFGRPGVPFYVLYPAGKSPIPFPELLTKSIVLDKLESIAPQVAAQ